MVTTLGERLLSAIDSGEFQTDVFPYTSAANPAATDLYEIVVRIADDEIGRVGVWKSGSGGIDGDGAPHVRAVGSQVRVSAGNGMNGSFDIDCSFESQSNELTEALAELFRDEYDNIEVEITNSA